MNMALVSSVKSEKIEPIKIKNSMSRINEECIKTIHNSSTKIRSTNVTLKNNEVVRGDTLTPLQSIWFVHEEIIEHQSALLTKVVSGLNAQTPKMYMQVSMAFIIFILTAKKLVDYFLFYVTFKILTTQDIKSLLT